MKSYTAYCMNEDGENMCMTREYNSKKDFASDLHGNGYKIHFIAITEKYDEESTKYHERLENKRRVAAIKRKCERDFKELEKRVHAEVMAELAAEEETNEEETTQEDETMRFKKDYFAVSTKKIDKFNAIRFDSDIEFYVTNCTENQEPEAIRKAVEKFIEELKKNENTEILVDSLEMMLNCNEYDEKCTFNEIRNGGNAYEIEINRGGDNDMFIYLRICEHCDDITQNDIDTAFEEYVVNEFEEEKKEAEKLPKLYRNQPDNAPEVLEMLKNCKSMMYDWRKNQVIFFKDEGHILGRAVNADNMDIAVVAQSLGKIYDRTI